mmetsp:Transcript_16041/g.28802  ORF Transcript_16041/g.28802 Transcript_16041/m.28802 type:complete len:169 (-) Transcript_16041:184-690(-)
MSGSEVAVESIQQGEGSGEGLGDVAKKTRELLRDNKKRFVIELEFVELLANPFYLQYLAQNRYFDDPRFINYLKYLQYWRKPEYIKFISYPHCLYFLDLLTRKEFREKLLDTGYVNLLHEQQYFHWRFHKHHRCIDRIRKAEQERLDEENKMPNLEKDGSTAQKMEEG